MGWFWCELQPRESPESLNSLLWEVWGFCPAGEILFGLLWEGVMFLSSTLFTLGCVGSSLLHRLFSSCSAWASHCSGFSCCRAQALGCIGFSCCGCSVACGIFPDQGSNLCSLHWQGTLVDSLSLNHQGSPWCGPFLKSLLNLFQYCFCFMFWFWGGCKACGILVPWPGIKLAPPALEGKALTTGPPGNSLSHPWQWKGRGWVVEGRHPVTSLWWFLIYNCLSKHPHLVVKEPTTCVSAFNQVQPTGCKEVHLARRLLNLHSHDWYLNFPKVSWGIHWVGRSWYLEKEKKISFILMMDLVIYIYASSSTWK